jgi:Predicted nucleotide-binding protein containing TIR-like domain
MNKIIDGDRILPSLFLGSSTEGLPIARTVRSLLADAVNVTMWNEGFFYLGSTFIETLVNELPKFDFAVLILTPDDLVTSRNTEVFGPRDNLIFELGLFTSGLGRSRTFIIKEGLTKLPTDLSGVTTAAYETPQTGQSVASAVGPACDSVRRAIEALGQSDTKTAQKLTHLQARQADIESNVRTLQIVVRGLVTDWEYEKLQGLASQQPFLVRFHNKMLDELYRLRAVGYVTPQPGRTISSMREKDGTGNEFDLREYIQITPAGQDYLKLREETSEAPL